MAPNTLDAGKDLLAPSEVAALSDLVQIRVKIGNRPSLTKLPDHCRLHRLVEGCRRRGNGQTGQCCLLGGIDLGERLFLNLVEELGKAIAPLESLGLFEPGEIAFQFARLPG